jgi:hypothetical protein
MDSHLLLAYELPTSYWVSFENKQKKWFNITNTSSEIYHKQSRVCIQTVALIWYVLLSTSM